MMMMGMQDFDVSKGIQYLLADLRFTTLLSKAGIPTSPGLIPTCYSCLFPWEEETL